MKHAGTPPPLDNNNNLSTIIKRIGIRFGLYWGIASIAIRLISYYTKSVFDVDVMVNDTIELVLNIILGISIIYLAIEKVREVNQGYISFAKACFTGFWSILVYTLFIGLYTFVFTEFILPDFSTVIGSQSLKLVSHPIFAAVLSMVFSLVGWGVFNIIASAALKKNAPLHR